MIAAETIFVCFSPIYIHGKWEETDSFHALQNWSCRYLLLAENVSCIFRGNILFADCCAVWCIYMYDILLKWQLKSRNFYSIDRRDIKIRRHILWPIAGGVFGHFKVRNSEKNVVWKHARLTFGNLITFPTFVDRCCSLSLPICQPLWVGSTLYKIEK